MHLGDARKFLRLDLGQKSYAEIFKFSECRHGTRNLVESSAGKAKGPDRKVWTLVVILSTSQSGGMHP